MRRSPRPASGRAAHPDRAVLAASFAEDVVLDLQCCEDSSSARPQEQQGSTATATSTTTSGTVLTMTATRTTTGSQGTMVTGSPKAAPRSNHGTPIPRPRSGTARDVDVYGRRRG